MKSKDLCSPQTRKIKNETAKTEMLQKFAERRVSIFKHSLFSQLIFFEKSQNSVKFLPSSQNADIRKNKCKFENQLVEIDLS